MNSALTIAQAQNQPQMVMDRNDLRRDWGPSALTPTNQASISAHYELPFGNAKSGFGKLTDGWQLNGITTLLSGFPFTPLIGANRSGDLNTQKPGSARTESIIYRVRCCSRNKRSGSTRPRSRCRQSRTWGNLGRGTLRGPGLQTLDLSVIKNTAVTERIGLQFRAEFFNALNHTNLGPPNPIIFSGNVD